MHQKWSTRFFGIADALLLAACGSQNTQEAASQPSATADNPAQKDWPTYLVATEASYAPFEFRDENGLIIGYDVDVLTAIGQDQGFKVQFINHAWDGIFDTLYTGERAIVAAGVLASDERKQQHTLSDPYATTPDLIVYMDKNLNLKSFEALKDVKTATQVNTTRIDNLIKLKGGNADVVGMPTLYLALKELVAGNVQAVVGDAAVLRYYMQGEPSIDFQSYEYNPGANIQEVAFVMKKGNTELQSKVNTGLRNIRANGTYDKINEKWFGKAKPAQ